MAQNLDLLLLSLEAWNRHDLARYRALYAPNAIIHGFAPVPLGLDAVLGAYSAFFAGFPDLNLTVEETLAEDERIAVRFTIRGVHTGSFQGMPATGQPIEVQGFSVLHYRDGLVVERWNQLDQMSMLQQIGALPAPA